MWPSVPTFTLDSERGVDRTYPLFRTRLCMSKRSSASILEPRQDAFIIRSNCASAEGTLQGALNR